MTPIYQKIIDNFLLYIHNNGRRFNRTIGIKYYFTACLNVIV